MPSVKPKTCGGGHYFHELLLFLPSVKPDHQMRRDHTIYLLAGIYRQLAMKACFKYLFAMVANPFQPKTLDIQTLKTASITGRELKDLNFCLALSAA